MLWVLKRIVSMRGSFEHPKHMLKLMGKKIFNNFTLKICVFLNLWVLYLNTKKRVDSIVPEEPNYCVELPRFHRYEGFFHFSKVGQDSCVESVLLFCSCGNICVVPAKQPAILHQLPR